MGALRCLNGGAIFGEHDACRAMLARNRLRAKSSAYLLFNDFALTGNDNRRQAALKGGQRSEPKVRPFLPHLLHETLQ